MDDLSDIVVVEVPETKNLNIEQIRIMIEECSKTEDGESLKLAMNELKSALKSNPAACAMMLPEDVGACTAHLRKMTNKLILDDIHGGKAKEKKEKIVIDQGVLDNLSMEDLM